jgi:hypothetical protein
MVFIRSLLHSYWHIGLHIPGARVSPLVSGATSGNKHVAVVAVFVQFIFALVRQHHAGALAVSWRERRTRRRRSAAATTRKQWDLSNEMYNRMLGAASLIVDHSHTARRRGCDATSDCRTVSLSTVDAGACSRPSCWPGGRGTDKRPLYLNAIKNYLQFLHMEEPAWTGVWL